jgi:hypothetical protein
MNKEQTPMERLIKFQLKHFNIGSDEYNELGHIWQDIKEEREQHANAKVLEALERERKISESLWILLDDIDTASDVFKPDNLESYKAFYDYAMKKQGERHKYLISDGYNLTTKQK